MTSTSSSFTPPRSADPEGFGQVVTLQKRIQKIMHDYKEGVSIFSELIQNADDAGAKRIEFIVDWREHKHEWDIFAGAGLLVFNDAPFTADDFEGIQKIDEGGKGKSLHKTGRFGVGFNTVYNLTDYPSIIGGSYLAWLDPHQDYATGPKPGDRWRLKDLAEEEWMSIYEVGHFRRKITNFKDKTLFRFPFRTSKQANKNKKKGHFGTQTVTRNNNINPLLTRLKKEGEELLIFLKSILEIKVREIEENGTEKVLLHIQTLNGDEVNQAHQRILNYPADQSVLNDQCKTDPSQLPVVSYRHTIQTNTPGKTTRSIWRVVHRIGVDPEGQLIEVMEKLEALQEKAVPWGGAAARIASDRSNQIQGKQYCFLPLPKTTGLPIHIHGYWDLDSARRSSTDDEGTGSAKIRSKWNELLAKEVVAIACADLMRDLVEDVGQKNPYQFYALWPLSPAQGISDFKIPFLKAVHQYPVIHSNLGKWVLPTEIYELPPNGQALFEPLTADGVPMASRLVPTEISAAFESAGHPFKTISPDFIRGHLRKLTTPLGLPLTKIPQASLQQNEWIVELLNFCLSDGHTDLRDLPLALLQDGTLHRFGQAPSGWIYRATSLQKELFSRFPQWFLDSEVEAVLPASEVKGVTAFTVELVVQRLVKLDWWQKASQGNGYLWEPDGAGTDLPNSAWLSLLYKYLATAPSPLPGSMKEVPFVPGLDNLYQGGYRTTPLWSATSIGKKYQDALNYFDIPIVSTRSIPKNLFEDFFNHHPENSLIFHLTPLDVIDTLETYAENHELPSYDEQQYRELLNYINTAALNQLKEDKGRQAKLKHLPIFPTTDGELVALEHEDYKVGVPEAELPPCELRIKLLDGGSQWKYLFEILGVKRLSLDILIQDHILPAYPNLNTDKQLKIMEWLQSALPKALSDLRSQRANDSRLKEAVKNVPLIKCTDGKLRSATKTYRPGTPDVLEVLGKNAAFPDMKSVYKGDPDSWLALFQCLGIQDKLQAQDLIDRINQLREELRNSSMDAVTDPCLRLLKYVEENWSQLQQQQVKVGSASMKFQEAIRSVQWLPVVTDPQELSKYPGAMQPAKQLYKSSDVLCFRDANIAASQGFKILPRESLPAKTKEEMGFHSPSFDQATAHLEQLIRIWESGSEKSLPNFDTAVKKVYQYLNSFLNLSQKETYKRKLIEKFNSKKCIWDGKGHFWKAEYVFTQKIQKLFGKHRFNCGEFNLYLALGQRKNVSWEDCNNFLSEIAIRYPNGITEQNEDAKADLQCVQHTLKHMISLMKQRKELGFILTEDNHLRPPNEVWLPDIKRYVEPVRNLGKVSLLHPKVDQKLGIAVGCNSLKKAREDKGTDMLLSREAKAKVQAERWQKQLQTSQFWEGLERLVRHEDKISPNDRFDVSWLKDFQIQVAEQVKTNLYWDTRKLIAKDVDVNYYCDGEAKVIYILYAPAVGSEFLAECLNGLLGKFALDNEICLVSILDKESDEIHNYLDQKGIQSLPKSEEEKDEELEEAEPVDFGESETEPTEPATHPQKVQQPTQAGKETVPPTQPSKNPARGSILNVQSSDGKNVTTSQSDRETNQAESETDSDKARENGSSYQGNSSDRRNASRSPYSNRPHSSGNNRTGQRTTDTQPRPQTTSNSSKSSQGDGFSADTRVRAKRQIEPSESEQLTQEKRREVGNKGVEIVLQYELEQGRTPVEMDQLWYNNPGYDIESTEQDEPDFDSRWCESRGTDGSIRYIEVKSFKGEWPRGGAKLSRRQFWFGLDAGEQFWLYVVEYVETLGKRKIHCIPNAAQETKSFYFDPGWKEVAQHFGEVWEEKFGRSKSCM